MWTVDEWFSTTHWYLMHTRFKTSKGNPFDKTPRTVISNLLEFAHKIYIAIDSIATISCRWFFLCFGLCSGCTFVSWVRAEYIEQICILNPISFGICFHAYLILFVGFKVMSMREYGCQIYCFKCMMYHIKFNGIWNHAAFNATPESNFSLKSFFSLQFASLAYNCTVFEK